ncbi:hypothetical protein, partial [Pseudomonas sp. 2995-3]|uniref:hypothetical protein n=1 Tax=Pseudomonas sp. 2995-3 TaxID=1712680 RepID=UPI001C45AD31
YIGSSPYCAPATFGLIGHLELNDGVYFTKGGNSEIAKGFEKLAKKIGVTVLTNTEIVRAKVKNDSITEVETSEGESFSGDVFILNGDLLTQYPRLVKEENRASFSLKGIQPSIS